MYGRLIENYLNKMSEVYKIYHFNWDQEDEMIYVEAEVADAVMSCSATLYEPEQWTHGRCYAEILWPDDDLVPAKAEGKESLMHTAITLLTLNGL